MVLKTLLMNSTTLINVTNLDNIKKQRHHFADKGPYSQSYSFSSIHVRIWEVNHKEGRAPKNWCFRFVVLGKTLESPSDSKEIKPVNPKGINTEYWLEGLTLKLKYFGHLMWRVDSSEKTLTLGDWRPKEKGVAEGKMVR